MKKMIAILVVLSMLFSGASMLGGISGFAADGTSQIALPFEVTDATASEDGAFLFVSSWEERLFIE